MLLKIIGCYKDGQNPEQFDELLENIKRAFWPAEKLEKDKDTLKKQLPEWSSSKSSDKVIQQTTESISKVIEDIANTENSYFAYKENVDTAATKKAYKFPFSKEIFEYFIERKYTIPYRDPRDHFDDLFRLERIDGYETDLPAAQSQAYNYSKNFGDYNHFINVVFATARFIEYFSKSENFISLFKEEKDEKIIETLRYRWNDTDKNNSANIKRCFLLMLAAFYHDLGKTIVYPRHAMEGSILIANHTTYPVFLIDDITKNTYSFEFNTEDLIYISNLVYYHDQYGTLGTGEAGYLRLVDLLHRIKRYNYRDRKELDYENHRKDEKHRVLQSVFDLWILNLADMLVSIPSEKYTKYQLRKSLFKVKETAEEIEKLVMNQSARKHDLHITIALVKRLCEKHHSDDFSNLEFDALSYARRHTVERIYRLIKALLIDYMPQYRKKFKKDNTSELLDRIEGIKDKTSKLLDCIEGIHESEWHAIISRSISYVSNFDEFVHRFAWVGQMDYSFAFFQKIAERAIQLFDEGNSCQSGWFYSNDRGILDEKNLSAADVKKISEQLSSTNAKNFSENFSSILVQIIHHLLFREKEFDRLINFEFRDAGIRLTKEKIDRIISAEGPHRAKRATQLALEGIYFFK